MSHRARNLLLLAIAMGFLVPRAVAQKPPAPPPTPAPPPSSPTNNPSTLPTTGTQPGQPGDEYVMFLGGRIATNDGASVPMDTLVARVCNNRVRQEVYASPKGEFSMQLGSRADSFPEASADVTAPSSMAGKNSIMGIPRQELTNCDLRVTASGFRSRDIILAGLDPSGGSVDVGLIVVERGKKIEGTTLNAAPYQAPKDARRAYEKGLQAESNGKLVDAGKYFETAVEIYPKFTSAWYQLGTVLQKENQKDAARKAYTQATSLDTRFLPPYLFLASMAYEAENWTEVLKLTGHLLDLDPLNQAEVIGYTLDLDPLNYADAYFFNSMANYKLNKIEAAEKSALKAERMDLRTGFPQLHLLLAEIFARKKNYGLAIEELQTYLALAPQAKDAPQQREKLASLEKLNRPVSTTEKPDQW
jgi:tetratricopeptide repeat protein